MILILSSLPDIPRSASSLLMFPTYVMSTPMPMLMPRLMSRCMPMT